MSIMTATHIDRLKVEAKGLKKSANIKHTAALAQIAQREGFSSWEALIAKAEPGAGAHHRSEEGDAERARRAERYDPTKGHFNCAGDYVMPKAGAA